MHLTNAQVSIKHICIQISWRKYDTFRIYESCGFLQELLISHANYESIQLRKVADKKLIHLKYAITWVSQKYLQQTAVNFTVIF